MRDFFRYALKTFLPSHWNELSQAGVGTALLFFSKVVVCGFVLIMLLASPSLLRMPGVISENLARFDTLQLSGNFTMSSPIKLPRSEPVVIFDTSGAYTQLTTERVLVTRDRIFYRPLFTTYELSTGELKDLKNNRDTVNTFLAMLVFFLLPSVLFYAYIAIWLKYFLLILVLSLVLFVLLDLTHWRRTWKELFVICCHVATLPVLAEVVVGAINAHWLVPVLNILGLVNIYLIPAVVLSVLAVGAALCVHYGRQEKRHDVV